MLVTKNAMEGAQQYGGNFTNDTFRVENNISLEAWKIKTKDREITHQLTGGIIRVNL